MGRFTLTESQVEELTGVRRRALERARADLAKCPFWEEKRHGTPAKNHYFMDFAQLSRSLLTETVFRE